MLLLEIDPTGANRRQNPSPLCEPSAPAYNEQPVDQTVEKFGENHETFSLPRRFSQRHVR
ncbi:hypothetical protein [Rhizobium laguerreae]|uniref:hypothetical protein n=1 Tax=Rhizobium laguerreae TaxID=1076926 RepID=UPI001FE9BA78|nr:hypothetical protein [Rhizobium laguerreae]